MTDKIMGAIQKALDDLDNETPSMDRNRNYKGQAWTDGGKRGEQLIEGLTVRDIRDCFVRAFILSCENERPENRPYYDEANKGEGAALCASDMFKLVGDYDPVAVSQNMSCEIEKMMGIFPNIDGTTSRDVMLELGIK
jgi:hypothetical protein|tara:strand:- start:56 stop:469 length:414 start_codon:yes stop_codon:yes gene_type:complete